MTKEQKAILAKLPKVIMLVGVPGSGKSTLSSMLDTVNRQSDRPVFRIVCQDEMGKELFEKSIETWKGPGTLLIDRTNLLQEDRDRMTRSHKGGVLYIVMRMTQKTIMDRLLKRKNHPTFSTNKFNMKTL